MIFFAGTFVSYLAGNRVIQSARNFDKNKKSKNKSPPNSDCSFLTIAELEKGLSFTEGSLFLVPYIDNSTADPPKHNGVSSRLSRFVFIDPALWNFLISSVSADHIKELDCALKSKIKAFNTPYPQSFVLAFVDEKTRVKKGCPELTINMPHFSVDVFLGYADTHWYSQFPTLRLLSQEIKNRELLMSKKALNLYSRMPFHSHHDFRSPYFNERINSLSYRESLSILSSLSDHFNHTHYNCSVDLVDTDYYYNSEGSASDDIYGFDDSGDLGIQNDTLFEEDDIHQPVTVEDISSHVKHDGSMPAYENQPSLVELPTNNAFQVSSFSTSNDFEFSSNNSTSSSSMSSTKVNDVIEALESPKLGFGDLDIKSGQIQVLKLPSAPKRAHTVPSRISKNGSAIAWWKEF